MAFQDWNLPPEIVFEWRKDTSLPTAISFNAKIRDIVGETEAVGYSNFKLRVTSGANWLLTAGDYVHNGVYSISTIGVSGDMSVSLSSYINTFNAVNKTAYLRFDITGQTPQDIIDNTYTILFTKLIPVRLKIYAADQPMLLPEKLIYVHRVGTTAPEFQLLNVDAPSSWEITLGIATRYDVNIISGSLVVNTYTFAGTTLKKIIGTGSGSFEIRPSVGYANSLSISPDPHRETIGVVYNQAWQNRSTEMILFVEHNIDIETDPVSLSFHAIKTVSEAAPQTIAVNASFDYTITGPSWAIINPNIGIEGISDIEISVVTSDLIDAGNYEGVLVFTYNNGMDNHTHEIPITYLVDGFVVLPYSTTDFNFTLDNKMVSFYTNLENTFFDVRMNIKTFDFFTGVSKDFIIPFKVVLFNGRQTEKIGKKIHRVMSRMNDLDLTKTKQYKTCEVVLTVEEKDMDTREIQRDFTLSNIKFIAGISPKLSNGMGILSIYNKPSRVLSFTKQVINLLLKPGNNTVVITKNGEVVNSYTINGEDYNVYTDIIDFESLETKEGDVIEYKLFTSLTDFVSKTYLVFPEGNQHLWIVWEDQYKLLSSMPFTGDYTLKTDFESKNFKRYRDLVEILENIQTNKEVKIYLNTGYVLRNEHISVESLQRSRRAWLIQSENEVIELVPQPKTLPNIDSSRELNSFDVELIINRKSDEEIYML